MIKLNPLTLVILNILFPVVIFLGKGIIYETICLLIAIVVLSIYKRYLQILKYKTPDKIQKFYPSSLLNIYYPKESPSL